MRTHEQHVLRRMRDEQAAHGGAAALVKAQAELARLQALLEGEHTTPRCPFLTDPLAGRFCPEHLMLMHHTTCTQSRWQM